MKTPKNQKSENAHVAPFDAAVTPDDAIDWALRWSNQHGRPGENLVMISAKELEPVISALSSIEADDYIGCVFCINGNNENSVILFPVKRVNPGKDYTAFNFVGNRTINAGLIQETWIPPTRPNGEGDEEVIRYFFENPPV